MGLKAQRGLRLGLGSQRGAGGDRDGVVLTPVHLVRDGRYVVVVVGLVTPITESSGTLVSPIHTMLTPLSLVTLVTTPSMRPLAVVVMFVPWASVAVTLMVYSPPSGCLVPSALLPSHLKV